MDGEIDPVPFSGFVDGQMDPLLDLILTTLGNPALRTTALLDSMEVCRPGFV